MLLQLVCAANTERVHKGIVYSERIIVINHDLDTYIDMHTCA